MDHGFLVAFDKSVEGLTTGGSGDDVRFVEGEMGFDSLAKKFLLAVGAKAFGKPVGLGAKKVKGRESVTGGKRYQ